MTDHTENFTVPQVAKLLGCSDRNVLNLIDRGRFPRAFKMDPNTRSRWRIPREDVDAFIELQHGSKKQSLDDK